MKTMKRTTTSVLLIIAPFIIAAILLLVFYAIDPVSVSPAGLLGVFVLWYFFWVSLLFAILFYAVPYVSRIIVEHSKSTSKRKLSVGVKKAYYIASTLAFAPVVLLAMRSFAQLKVTDVLLVAILMGVAIFYIVKRF